MAKPSLSILSISYDESLLRTRQWILENAGFHVTSVLGFTEASQLCQKGGFDLVILGHSIPIRDKAALLQFIRNNNHTRVLALSRQGEPEVPGAQFSLEAWEGPDALIVGVKKALGIAQVPE